MKFTMLIMLIGLLTIGCKKEPRTERPLTTDSIIADTMRTDTVPHIAPAPMPSDSIRTDSLSSPKNKDTIGVKRKTSKK